MQDILAISYMTGESHESYFQSFNHSQLKQMSQGLYFYRRCV